MTWRMEVSHTTVYEYPRPVAASYNEARLSPLSTDRQLAIRSSVEIDPAVRPYRYWDYWGTLVHAFDVHVPHERLTVTARSVVETPSWHGPDDPADIGWDTLVDSAVADRFFEFLAPTATVSVDDGLAAVAAALKAESPRPADAVDAAAHWVRAAMVYERGTTGVSTSAVDAWRHGRGVCQDFVHVALALVRAMGIPARYVSGYLHPDPEGSIDHTVVGESHAWAEAWLGDWHPFDPTNQAAVGERHVLVARGREYGDVPPLKGVYSGAPSSVQHVAVQLTRRA